MRTEAVNTIATHIRAMKASGEWSQYEIDLSWSRMVQALHPEATPEEKEAIRQAVKTGQLVEAVPPSTPPAPTATLRTALITQLIQETTPFDAAAVRTALRQHGLSLTEMDALTHGLMVKALAAQQTAEAPTDADASLADVEADPEMLAWLQTTAGTPADDGGVHLSPILATTPSGHLDIQEMQRRCAAQVEHFPSTQPHARLLQELCAYVALRCPDLKKAGQQHQVRLAANAVLVATHPAQPLLQEQP